MDGFFERLTLRAATIDELLSNAFEPLPGSNGDAELAAKRLAAWRKSSAAGDGPLFERRLARDSLTLAKVQDRFAGARRSAAAAVPAWIEDAVWIEAALQSGEPSAGLDAGEPCPFEQLWAPLVEKAQARICAGLDARIGGNLSDSARACLRRSLTAELSGLCTPALYERFAKARRYDSFVAGMKDGGFRLLFEDKPVLLRLIAVLTRQWIDTSREFLLRLDADLAAIRHDLLPSGGKSRVAGIEGDLSDPHNGGRSVLILSFEDGACVVYKPKDLRVDTVWHDLVERLNGQSPPVELKAVRTLARDGYGWTEFVGHTACAGEAGIKAFFRRAGAWLALFHCFAATDMHQENMIAAGEHPVPIDLETILQPSAEEHKARDAESAAFDAAMDIVGNSVMTVGLLPAYGRSVDNNVFAMGGLTADWDSRTVIVWNDINTDEMRPAKAKEVGKDNPNLPHVAGQYAKFGEHIEDFISGFAAYAKFLTRCSRGAGSGGLFDGFAGLPVRKVVRPTRFYYMLLQRLKNHRTMDDGVMWSAQADFVARLAEWEKDADPLWPLLRLERAALLTLNVPHFVSPSDGGEIADASGHSVRTEAISGLARARSRVASFDEAEIAWQVEVIRENTNPISASVKLPAETAKPEVPLAADPAVPAKQIFLAEADRIAAELARLAIRRGPGAAWIGLDWLGDSEVFQLVCLGPDLYNGACGIALFLAAHAAVASSKPSGELALAAVSHLRKSLKGRNAARTARALGIGGAVGLGSVVYALAVMAKCLRSAELLADAKRVSDLFTGELIAADRQLDVMGGSAGGILGLLRLHRDTGLSDVLDRATRCGEHLLAQPRLGAQGGRTWVGQGSGAQGLNGMSHGAAGFAYALGSLAAATGREDFAQAASECVAFENASYDPAHHNWPDLRGGGALWTCQWCHGAPGIGLARLAASRRAQGAAMPFVGDIRNAVEGAERGSPAAVDTLCCGMLGSIEFFCEASGVLERGDLRDLASRQLMAVVDRAKSAGDYRWNSGKGQFNLGLFRGLAGVGYTLLRQVDAALPNVLIWE